MVFFKLTERSLGLISTVILARLLIPSDFGLIAMAMSIIAALELMSAFSFDVVLIHKQSNASREDFNTAWTFNILFAVGSATVLTLLARPAAHFYGEPHLETVIYLLAIGSLVQGIENIGIIKFRMDMEFRKEFKFQIGKKLAGFLVTVPLAFLLKNYWALVCGMLASKSAGVILSYVMNTYRPRLCLKSTKGLFNFSKWLLINNIVSFFMLRAVDFIIGKTAGSRQLGLYAIGYEISNLPTSELVAPINRAVYPGYAMISAEIEKLRSMFLSVIGHISMMAMPAGAGIAATAELLVPVILGEKWLDAIPLMKLLAISGAITALYTNIGMVYFSLGKARTLTIMNGIYVLLFVPMAIFLSQEYGAIGAAWACLVATSINLPLNYIVLRKYIHCTLGDFTSVAWRPVLASLFMYLVVHYYIESPSLHILGTSVFLTLLTAVILGVLTYVSGVLLLWVLSGKPEGAEVHLIKVAYDRLVRHKATPILP